MLPSWINGLRIPVLAGLLILPIYVGVMMVFGNSPVATDAGYQPLQPVPFSHALHAGELGMDCRYCHTAVERSAFATVPTTTICMNCHVNILGNSEKLQPVRDSFATGLPVEWMRVHDLPDFAYFNHSAHVRRGVACVSCHGRVDTMDETGVYQDQPLSMGWCLDCHRNPEPHLRPVDQVTNMNFHAPGDDPLALGRELRESLNLNPSTDCSTCH